MITIKLNASGKQNIVGIYAPNDGKSVLVAQLQHAGFEHYQFGSTTNAMINTLLQHLGYTPDEIYAMVYGKNNNETIDTIYHNTTDLAETLTAWGRQTIAPDIWLQTLQQRLRTAKNRQVVISDLSYPNEHHWITNQNGFTVCILTPDMPFVGRLNYHKFNLILENDNPKTFERKCKLAVKEIKTHFARY